MRHQLHQPIIWPGRPANDQNNNGSSCSEQSDSSKFQNPERRDFEREQMLKANDQLLNRSFRINVEENDWGAFQALFLSPSWTQPELQASKTSLNTTKDLLNEKDIRTWGKHTGFTNCAGDVVYKLRDKFQPEMCTIAWAKMYECLIQYDLIPRALAAQQGAILSVHLCEAPGGFIAATNHYVRTELPACSWDWVGVSLNPYYEGNDRGAMIDDDALIQATLSNWCFGKDNSGDIRKLPNIKEIWAESQRRAASLGVSGAALVTGDGSIDCQEDPNEQEAATAPLHFCEAVAALGLLCPGGSLLLKAFMLLEHPSICLLHLLGSAFEELHVFKPATSKPGNSETYIIGKCFKGVPESVMDSLQSALDSGLYMQKDKAMLHLDEMPSSFLSSAVDCARFFAATQQRMIEDNISMEGFMPGPLRWAIKMAKSWLAEEWITMHRMKQLPQSRLLAPEKRLRGDNNNTSNALSGGKRERLSGTLEERRDAYRTRRQRLGRGAEDIQLKTASRYDCGSSSGGITATTAFDKQQASAPGHFASPLTPLTKPSNHAVSNMMDRMGYKPGQGLGATLQGQATPLEVSGNMSRNGLGFGLRNGNAPEGQPGAQASFSTLTSSHTCLQKNVFPQPSYCLFPDTKSLTLTKAAGIEQSTIADHQQSQLICAAEVATWGPVAVHDAPPKLIGSKWLPEEMVVHCLLEARTRVHEGGHCCRHVGSCTLPQHTPGMPSWTMSSLDKALGILAAMPANTEHNRPVMLDLSLKSAEAAAYVLTLEGAQEWDAWTAASSALPDCQKEVLMEYYDSSRLRFLDESEAVNKITAPDAIWSKAGARRVKERIGHRLQLLVCGVNSKDSVAASVMEGEYDVAYLRQLLCEAAIGLSCLSAGGSMVLKLGDCLTSATVSVVYLLARSFRRITLVKPFTTCAASNDRFLVCQGRHHHASSPQDDEGDSALCNIEQDWALERMLEGLEALSALPPSTKTALLDLLPPSRLVASEIFAYLAERSRALAIRETAVLQALASDLTEDDPESIRKQRQAKAFQALDNIAAVPTMDEDMSEPGSKRLQASIDLLDGRYDHNRVQPAGMQTPDAIQKAPSPWHSELKPQLRSLSSGFGLRRPTVAAPSHTKPQPAPIAPAAFYWKGELMVKSHKGREFICSLSTNEWPVHYCPSPEPLQSLVVERYMNKTEINFNKCITSIDLTATCRDNGSALQGLMRYMAGYRLGSHPTSAEKFGVLHIGGCLIGLIAVSPNSDFGRQSVVLHVLSSLT
ncbi:hypothetical protein CEUSTIGMA_g10625.t1 [Chlamydomonas eustigma]|uniref:Cap-specific mRNA (nucleoside-2'-O-)-methyltransferase 2 n=1 Tax=Chlamydomonas eustigma TaxID=1157962 RepID=A0A250XJU9_9CHLO|nr:hypothetical protein CEUSTIGMA_g10625.t1 [Chlamydomonas eustigma]|eukprot:GAX83199.1 hypothetical protein CEUSTIGMA_g10625.t1 [Chlamydomonas eustigma]